MKEKVYDLEDRLVELSVRIADIVDILPNTRLGNYVAGQLTRCGSAPALNYGEAQGAESRDDFIHKLKVVLKELKETRICLKIISRKQLIKDNKLLSEITKEDEELIAIIFTSIQTAKNNNNKNQ